MRSKDKVLVRETTQGQEKQKQMAGHEYGQPMVVGGNLNDAEGHYVLKLRKWKEKNDFSVTIYYRRKTESNLDSTTICENNKLHRVINYWGKLFYSKGGGPKSITVMPDEILRLFNFGEMDFNLLRCYELFLTKECECSRKKHVAFLEPFFIRGDKNELKSILDEDAEGYITAAIRKFKDNKAFIMIPFLERGHWILIVIVPKCRLVWYLNSKRDFNTSAAMPDLIERAYKNVTGIIPTRRDKKCHLQPGNEECGFYVCYHMWLLSEHKKRAKDVIIDDAHLTSNQMNTVRAGICEIIYNAANF